MSRSDSVTGPEAHPRLQRPPRSVSSVGRAPPEAQHHRAEGEQRQPPPQVDVDAERALVNRRIAEESEPREQQPQQGEHHAERYADVETHGEAPYQKRRLSSSVAASTPAPSTAGRVYHA